jgi:2-dehydro-3-deoxygluconokinase
VYDRAGSAFSLAPPSNYEWTRVLQGADILHVSGITPAVGPNAANATLQAVEIAAELGVEVSFDGNYREALWKVWSGDGPQILKDILSKASIAFVNERDLGLIFSTTFESRVDAINRAFDTFPRLHTISCTSRQQTSVVNQTLTGELYTRSGNWTSASHNLVNVVDRIGGGDAFAAGLLAALLQKQPPQHAIDFATAASVIKHSIPGDALQTTYNEVVEAMDSHSFDVKR